MFQQIMMKTWLKQTSTHTSCWPFDPGTRRFLNSIGMTWILPSLASPLALSQTDTEGRAPLCRWLSFHQLRQSSCNLVLLMQLNCVSLLRWRTNGASEAPRSLQIMHRTMIPFWRELFFFSIWKWWKVRRFMMMSMNTFDNCWSRPLKCRSLLCELVVFFSSTLV